MHVENTDRQKSLFLVMYCVAFQKYMIENVNDFFGF